MASDVHEAAEEHARNARITIGEEVSQMKRFSIVLLLALAVFAGVGAAQADEITLMATGSTSIQSE